MICEKHYLYEDRTDVTLTTYIWDNSRSLGTGPNMKRPAVIICPGGGYLGCSDREGEPIALKFVAMGYNAFVLRYSTYSKGPFGAIAFDAELEPQPETAHPAPVREVGKAILMIREHARKWRVDADRIALCGFSAGGHNVALYAASWHRPIITDYFNVDKELLRPAAVILGYAVTDYIFTSEISKVDPFQGMLWSSSSVALFGTKTPSKELLEEASPVRLVDENTPPMFIWATQHDDLVPVRNALSMAQALSDNNIPFALHVFEDGNHGLATADQASAPSKFQMSDEISEWIPMVEKWLLKRFALPLPELCEQDAMSLAGK